MNCKWNNFHQKNQNATQFPPEGNVKRGRSQRIHRVQTEEKEGKEAEGQTESCWLVNLPSKTPARFYQGHAGVCGVIKRRHVWKDNSCSERRRGGSQSFTSSRRRHLPPPSRRPFAGGLSSAKSLLDPHCDKCYLCCQALLVLWWGWRRGGGAAVGGDGC